MENEYLKGLSEKELELLLIWIIDHNSIELASSVIQELSLRTEILLEAIKDLKEKYEGAKFKCHECGEYKCNTNKSVMCNDCLPF